LTEKSLKAVPNSFISNASTPFNMVYFRLNYFITYLLSLQFCVITEVDICPMFGMF
jgi:hypothetical protein